MKEQAAREAISRDLAHLALPDDALSPLLHDWEVWARDDQLPPAATHAGDVWRTWLILGGRGAGKTRAGAEWVRAQALGLAPFASEPAFRIALVGETMHDVRAVMVEGVSGLLAIHPPDERPVFEPSNHRLVWPNGAIAELFSAEDPDSLRGPQFHAAWSDEIAKWRLAETAFDMLQFGLRLGSDPRQVVTTTPRPVPILKRLMSDAATVVTRARTHTYWRPSRSAEMPPAVALMHFDATVNHGLLGAARILQSVLGVEVDGEIGPVTMAAVRRADPSRLVAAYAEARRQRYRALHHFWRFGTGWLNRVAATERLAATSAFTSSPAPSRRTPMTDTTSPQSTEPTAPSSKWWGESLTVWGALVTAVSTVLPVIGPLVGLELTPDLVRKLGDQTLVAVQAFGGVVGTLMTILGRARASTPLSRRSMTIQL